MPSETGVFLVLIALVPGWWFLRRRERVTGDQHSSNLDELLQVLVAGLATTGIPLAILLLWPTEHLPLWILNVEQWLAQGDSYLRGHLPALVLTSVAVLVTAILIAHTAANCWPSPRRTLNDRSSMWVNTIDTEGNPGHKYISTELQDGRVFEGYLFGITPDGPVDEQVLSIEKPIIIKSDSGEEGEPYPVDRVALPISQLRYVSVKTIPAANSLPTFRRLSIDRTVLGRRIQANLSFEI